MYIVIEYNGIDGVIMSVHERRQHLRIEDYIYFDYKLLENTKPYLDQDIVEELLGQRGNHYLETTQYFHTLDLHLKDLIQAFATQHPTIVQSLNVLNSKIEYLTRYILLDEKIQLRKVSISLGGMSFKTNERIQEKTHMKIVIYTKPQMLPVLLDAIVIYSQFHNEKYYRTAVQFQGLNNEQAELLSQHIMLVQTKYKTYS